MPAIKDYSDNELFESIVANKRPQAERAFAELYARYGTRVYMYCNKILGDSSDAQDVFQNTFIRFHAAAQKGYDVRNVGGYLFKIARNLCFNHKRDNKELLALDDFNFATADTGYEKRELLRLIDTALEVLDLDYREAFVLKEYQGMTYPQIAEVTGDSVPALKNRVWRAKEKIRKFLTPYLADLEKF